MVASVVAGLLFSVRQSYRANLVVNPTLEGGPTGWTEIWSRNAGTAVSNVESGRKDGAKAIHVVQRDTLDWAISQVNQIPVKPNQIYELSGWMKSEGGTAEISLVARDSAGSTTDWALGRVSPNKSGWQYLKRRCVIPLACKTIQFRLVGTGVGNTWLEAPTLNMIGEVPTVEKKTVPLSGKRMSLRVDSDGTMTATSKNGDSWSYRSWSGNLIIRAFRTNGTRHAEWDATDVQDDRTLRISVDVDPNLPEALVTIRCLRESPEVPNEFNPVGVPGTLATRSGQALVIPMNEGIRFPVEDKTLNHWSLIAYGGHGLCMPWNGVYNPKSGSGLIEIIETPNDADVFYTDEGGLLSFQPRWEATRQTFGYTRKVRISLIDQGGYVAMAKRYRSYAQKHGLFKTLKAKRAENPNVDRLIGAVNVWNWDMDKVSLCSELKRLGFDHVLWSGDGNAQQIQAITQFGYLPGRYDIYQDVWDPKNSLSWQNTEGWPHDLVLEPSGEWMKGWSHPDKQSDGSIKWYQGGVISSGAGLQRAKRKIPLDLAKIPYQARFIDTTTAAPFREDYNPLHPLSRSDDRANKMALLDFCSKDMKLVTGTETGIDPSVPFVHYYEGMMSLGPFRLPDSGTFMMEYRKPTPEFLKYQVGPEFRLPIWELVYHDCTVAQWYWGDASNKVPEVWDQRDLLNILYGTPPLLMFDKERWAHDKQRMRQTYQNVCRWVRKIGYDEMLSHTDVTPDHLVQRTTWSSGRNVTVNFGSKPYQGIGPMSFSFKTFLK
jgi:Glycosyl hydrolases related to GH101 family, GH129/Carbohydrate binding domain